MTRHRARALWWAVSGLYLALTYATLGAAPIIWKAFDNALGKQGVIPIYALYITIAVVIGRLFVIGNKKRSRQQYLVLVLLVGVFFLIMQQEKNPGEKIHMAQYGALGILLYRALRVDFDRFDYRLYLHGSVISLMAGELDEIIQGLLANRWFTWHDVFVNGFSSILALLFIRFVITDKGQEDYSHSHSSVKRGELLLMGVVSCWPAFHLVFLGGVLLTQALGYTFHEDMVSPLLLLTIGWSFVLFISCTVYVWKAAHMGRRKKNLWFLALLCGHVVAMPVFWYVHLRHLPMSDPSDAVGGSYNVFWNTRRRQRLK